MKKLNLNSIVKVKLSDYGKDIYYHRYDEINDRCAKRGAMLLKTSYPDVDNDGYTRFQLWDFMQLYGKYMLLGNNDVGLENLNIYIDEDDLEDIER